MTNARDRKRSTVTKYDDLAVRCARAEIERDEAREELRKLRELQAAMYRDPEKMLDQLHVIGIPARDLRDIYRVVEEWNRVGGNTSLLEHLRKIHPVLKVAA